MQDPRSGNDVLRERLEQSLSGSYRIEREIGGGGMSRVFLAEETSLGRRVVVKVLSPDLAHEMSAERFEREIRLSARLQHSNIVPMLTAGTAAGLPYYTMPFIDGESLRARLQRTARGEPIAFATAIEILRDVARALAYAHNSGVVHRDIKPENVLLGYESAVVADFGVAKALAAARTEGGSSATATLTQGGVTLGTPAYMSPEQAAGDPDIDARADLYAWGVMAYELLSGRHPFADKHSIQALVTAHLIEQPRSLLEVAPHVPPPLGGLVMRCLAKSKDDRPSSAHEVIEVLASTATPAERATQPRQLTGGHVRRRAAIGVALGVIAAAAAGTVVYGLRRNTTGAVAAPSGANTRSPGYEDYMNGWVLLRNENRQDNAAAIVELRKSIEKDPLFAPAHAALARALAIKVFYYAAADSDKKQLNQEAQVAVEKALQLDKNLGDAYFARGLLLWTPSLRFPHEQAISAYKRALQLAPELDEAHHQLALVYLHIGLLDEAKLEVGRALDINSSNTLARFRYGVIDLYSGKFDAAYRFFNSTPLDQNPSLWAFQMATVLFRLGRVGEATALIDDYLKKSPNDEGGVGNSVRAMIFAKAGRRADAEAAIATAIRLVRSFGHFHHAAYNIASAYALLGERAKAVQWLQDAADDGFPCYPLFASDTQLDNLRSDSGFVSLMTRLEAEWKERKRTLAPT
jgi:tetratricopeptide (TPR) repeat protein/tRNA A-37 threonylcarbamoyl transferase component Bud32